MKKIFLIPLMALMSCVMAFATVRTAGTFAELQSALTAAVDGDEIQLTADINYSTGNTVAFSVSKNVTIDGQGHTISGSGKCVFSVQGTSAKHVTAAVFKNLKLNNSTGRVFQLYDYLDRVDIDNCELGSQGGSSIGSNNPEVITPWSDTGQIELNLTNTRILATASGYPIITHNPLMLNATNSFFAGYCGLYFKSGSAGSIVNADACNFDAPNIHSGQSNSFAVFPMEDTPLTFNLNNCGMNAEQLGDQGQPVFTLSEYTKDADRTGQVNITISGDNTYINCDTEWLWNSFWWNNPSGTPQYGSNDAPTITTAEAAVHVNVNAQVTGGTYSADPREMIYWNDQYKDGEDYHYNLGHITIPDGYEVKEIETQQGDQTTTLYRVRKTITTSYSINEDVEGVGAGQNENTEFFISADETVAAESTVANYVEVSSNATLTVPAGKDLVVTNGLDVTSGAQVKVEAGSTLVVGEGGVTTESTESIEIGADENGSASFLLSPDVIVNTTPNLTIKMHAKEVGYEDVGGYRDWYFHRFALPVESASLSTITKVPNHGVYLYGWDYAINNWSDPLAWNQLRPFYGYSMAPDAVYGDMTITIKGQLVGNTDRTLEFSRGYNFFGNSYTGYISVLKLISMLGADENIDGTVWMWNSDLQTYGAVPLGGLQRNPARFEDWQKEVAPMQTFVLRLVGAESGSADLSYAEAIWGNPRYSAFTGVAAPAMRNSVSDDTFFRITVRSDNGRADAVDFTEDMQFSDAYDKSYDAVKYMNAGCVNMYTAMNGERYTSVATDNIEGKRLTLETVGSYNYTLSFSHVSGTEYALRDNVTGAVTPIVEGNMYSFVAQPNSTAEGRFEIVPVRTMPTAIENAEAVPAAKGIYSMQGQYLGNDLNVLPAGVYVVDGVRIVK